MSTLLNPFPLTQKRPIQVGDGCGPKPADAGQPNPTANPAFLAPLMGIRFLLAIHLFLFHYIGHEQNVSNSVRSGWPAWLQNLLIHGYSSTYFFFILSGFIMTYLYVDQSGQMIGKPRQFFFTRLMRLFPLHLLVALLLIPHAVPLALAQPDPKLFKLPISSGFYATLSGLFTITMTHAWLPGFALRWNPPTWALAAVVFFYLLFPWSVRLLRGVPRRGLVFLLAAAPVLSLLPSIVYLLVVGHEIPYSFWHEVVMRSPLLWLPSFFVGMLFARCYEMSRFSVRPTEPVSWRFRWGDAAALFLLGILCLGDETLSYLLCLCGYEPHLLLRHGLLAPLFLVVLRDLAAGRGILSRLLSSPVLLLLAEGSFAIFILQSPLLVAGDYLLGDIPLHPQLRLAALTVILIAASSLSVRWFEQPVNRWLRRFFRC
jgi:peptidoglycan/LPS O-acetylase OafA/YrhL